MHDRRLSTLPSGLAMGESARWHDGRFWCSDWVAGEILAVETAGDGAGHAEVAARSSSIPFCFDWLADGTMLVTCASGLERLAQGALVPHADLTALGPTAWNEVIAHPSGNVYVNSPNFEFKAGADFSIGKTSGVV